MVFKSQQYMCCLKAGFDPAKQAELGCRCPSSEAGRGTSKRSYDLRDVVINQLMVSVRELDEKHPMTAHLIKLTSPVSYPGIRVSEEEE